MNYLKFLLEADDSEKEIEPADANSDAESDTKDVEGESADTEKDAPPEEAPAEGESTGDDASTEVPEEAPAEGMDMSSDSTGMDDSSSMPAESSDPSGEEVQADFVVRDHIYDSLVSVKSTFISLRTLIERSLVQFANSDRIESIFKKLLNKIDFDIEAIDDIIKTDAYNAMEIEALKSLHKIYLLDAKRVTNIIKDLIASFKEKDDLKTVRKKQVKR